MSILIKGMEMPFCCLVCPCSGTDNTEDGDEVWICEVSELRQITTKNKIEHRPEWCPLVPVPPHGRLIDADALCEGRVSNDNVVIYAKTAPTIIPAEEDEI